MQQIRKKIIVFFTFIGGLYFFLEFILPADISGFKFGIYHEEVSLGVQLIGLMAIGLGIINIFRVHGTNILKNKPGWVNSLALLLGLIIIFIFQTIDFRKAEEKNNILQEIQQFSIFAEKIIADSQTRNINPEPRILALIKKLHNYKKIAADPESPLGTHNNDDFKISQQTFVDSIDSCLSATEELRLALENHQSSGPKLDQLNISIKGMHRSAQELLSLTYEELTARKASNFIFNGFFVPLGSAMFSLLAFYIVTAAYRSFRIRSVEAFVMMIPAVIVMLGQIPHGPIYVYHDLPEMRRWLLEYLNTPAFRAIFFGSSIAGLAMALRMWLSLEKSPLSGDMEDKK